MIFYYKKSFMIYLHEPYYNNLMDMLGASPDSWYVPLRIPVTTPLWPSLCNPSIFIDNDNIRLILRNVNYILHNSIDPYSNWSSWGPVHYITPAGDYHLRTRNWLCELGNNSISYKLIDTSELDQEPQWDFVGLEDARIVRWEGHLWLCGVRRDDNDDGHGRMEMSRIDESGKELERIKIEVPWDSYCEKNWVPVIDKPYHFVRTSNPTMIMKIDPKTCQSEIEVKRKWYDIDNVKGVYKDNNQGETLFRGSSQAIPYENGHIAIVHTCELYFNETGRKVARYLHHFIIWDNVWNIKKISPSFSFCGYNIEFTNGLALKDGVFYIPFSLQDGFSYLLKASVKDIENIIDGNWQKGENPEWLPSAMTYWDDWDGFEGCEKEADYCLNNGYKQEAYIRYWRMIEQSRKFPITPEKQKLWLLKSMKSLGWGFRDDDVQHVISILEERWGRDPEVLMLIAQYYKNLNRTWIAKSYAQRASQEIFPDYIFQIMNQEDWNRILKDCTIIGEKEFWHGENLKKIEKIL